MWRYIKAFSKDQIEANRDRVKGLIPTLPHSTLKVGEEFPNRKSLTGWQIIRHSVLGLEFGQEEPEDDQDIKYM